MPAYEDLFAILRCLSADREIGDPRGVGRVIEWGRLYNITIHSLTVEMAINYWGIAPVPGTSHAIRKGVYALFGLLLILNVLQGSLFSIHKKCM